VEVLGKDPLSVIEGKAESSGSSSFQDLLSGYVATVRTGGSVVNYLESKLRSAFELQAALAKQAIDKLGMIVDAYMSILVIAMISFALAVSMSATDVPIASMPPINVMSALIMIATPTISVFFIYIAHTMRESTIMGVDKMFRNATLPVVGVTTGIMVLSFLPDLRYIVSSIGLAYLLGIGLIGASILPMIKYERVARLNISAERAMPRFIRNVTETRKTGLSPIRCIIQSARGKNYGLFTKRLNSVADQLEWGVPLRRVFSAIKDELRSWPVLINMFILLEVIETGGGYADTLEALAQSSERIQNIEEEKRSMLKPYVILPVVVTALLSFTTMVLIQSFVSISEQPLELIAQLTTTLSSTIILQSWMSGFFIGKVTSGAFASGFKYAVLLAAVALVSIIMTSQIDFNLGAVIKS
jgi:flagellar protein FlaJ